MLELVAVAVAPDQLLPVPVVPLLLRRSQQRRKKSQRRTSTWVISSVAVMTTIEEEDAAVAAGRYQGRKSLADNPIRSLILPPRCAAHEKVLK